MLVLEWKGRAFMNSRCFCWFPAAILVDSFCPPVWRLHTKLYKGAWNVSATNSETVGHKDLRFGQIVYILVFYNISFSWLLPLDGFRCTFLCRVYCVTVKTKKNCRTFQSIIYPADKNNFIGISSILVCRVGLPPPFIAMICLRVGPVLPYENQHRHQ